jgi:broad specificity phosphatase PhoE
MNFPVPVRLVLVRHGETIWHAENRYAGRSDIALSPKGYTQAGQLARWAETTNLAGVWSSPLVRARLTAVPCAEAANLPLHIDERLRELDFGRGEGLTEAEMRAQFPGERAAFERDPAANPLPDGEVPEQATARGMAALQGIAVATGESGGAGSRGLVVAHNTLLRLLLCRLLGMPLSGYRTAFPHFANGTLTEIELTPRGAGLLRFNVPLPT